MIKFFTKRLNNKKGFTLVELIVVIAILGILIAIAAPQIGKFRTRAARSAHNANVRTLESAANMYIEENGIPSTGGGVTWNGTTAEGEIDEWKEYIKDWPVIPKGLEDESNNPVTGKYEVKIGTDGKVTVTPDLVPEEASSTT